MVEESYVSFDTAKLLKEVGFDVPCRDFFTIEGDGNVVITEARSCRYHNSFEDCFISRPTLALAARWLREKHKIHVGADMAYSKLVAEKWIYQIRFTDSIGNPYKSVGWFNDYEEALEAGLQEAIKLIKK